MLMKTVAVIFLWLAVVAAPAQINQDWPVCRNHLRSFGGRAVDLTPLFQWWARQPVPTNAATYTSANLSTNVTVADADRPLSAWHRVTGTHVGSAGDSWVIEAVIYTSPNSRTNARVFLNHPPVLEEQNYYTLKTQLAEADAEIAAARQVFETNTNTEQRALELANRYRHSLSKVAPTGVNINMQEAQQTHDAAAVALNRMDQLSAQRQQIVEQLKTIPARQDAYSVDWFAVKLGYTKKGVPIYDLGLVNPLLP